MLARSFLIESSLKLLVTRTGIKAQWSSILGRIRPLILELLALEWGNLHFWTWISLLKRPHLPFGLLVCEFSYSVWIWHFFHFDGNLFWPVSRIDWTAILLTALTWNVLLKIANLSRIWISRIWQKFSYIENLFRHESSTVFKDSKYCNSTGQTVLTQIRLPWRLSLIFQGLHRLSFCLPLYNTSPHISQVLE